MIPTAAVVLLVFLAAPPQEEVVYSSGRVQLVQAVAREEGSWVLSVAGGTVRVPVADVREIRNEPFDLDARREAALALLRVRRSRSVRFEVAGRFFVAGLPDGFHRDPATESAAKTPLLVFRDENRAIRIAWSRRNLPFWSLPGVVKRHHRKAYEDYATTSEDFCRLGGRDAWLVTFRYRRGPQTRVECQGFLDCGDGLLVVSMALPAMDAKDARDLVHSVCRSVREDDGKDRR